MPATTTRPVLVAVFAEDRRARVVLHVLRDMGFMRHQLGYVARHGEVLEAAGSLTAVDVPEHDLTGGLICLGVPVAAARELAPHLERGHTIITVQPSRVPQLAERELQRAGALLVRTWQAQRPI
jgi:hypothetical protein